MFYLKQLAEGQSVDAYLMGRLSRLLQDVSDTDRDFVLAALLNNGPGLPEFGGAPESFTADSAESVELVHQRLPLLEGEELLEESLTMVPAAAGFGHPDLYYLVQKTSFAEIAIQIPGPDEPTEDLDDEVMAFETVSLEPMIAAWALAIAKKIGAFALSQLGSAVWSAIERDILGKKTLKEYLTEIYHEILNVIKSEFRENYMANVANLGGEFRNSLNKYNTMGKEPRDLEKAVDNASKMMVAAANAYLDNEGAFHYAEGTMYYILGLQETYKNMLESGRFTPEQLAAARQNIANYAKEGADTLQRMRDALLVKRMAQITDVFYHSPVPSNPANPRRVGNLLEGPYYGRHDPPHRVTPPKQTHLPMHNKFEDKATKFWVSRHFWLPHAILRGDTKYSWQWVKNHRDYYAELIREATVRDLDALLEVADQLKKLSHKPVPDPQ